ncbi:MAG: transcriptional repressor LexA [Blastocatellia bacterium]|jgi:repressor LexA
MALTTKQIGLHDFLSRFHLKHGYAPTIAEIQQHFKLNSPATVHEQLAALEREGLIKRQKYVQRGIELIESSVVSGEFEIPLLGVVAAGFPIEAVLTRETITVAPDLFASRRFALRVRGDSMRDEQIADGDLIIVEPVESARNGETVVALVDDLEATVKKIYNERTHIRLQPANDNYEPIIVKPPRRVRVQGVVVGLIRRYK